jgi:hypothetical protein
MGTNYYVIDKAGNKKHFGKRSAGWDFALHVYPDEGIRSLEDWLVLLSDKNAEVRDDSGRKIKLKHLLRIVLMGEGCALAESSLPSGMVDAYGLSGCAVLNPFTNRLHPKPDWEHIHSIHTSYYCLNYNFV